MTSIQKTYLGFITEIWPNIEVSKRFEQRPQEKELKEANIDLIYV